MPHRVSSNDERTFSDHEVQRIKRAAFSAVGNQEDSASGTVFEPVDNQYLDNDEVAELVYFRGSLSVDSSEDSTSQSQPAEAGATVSLGANIGSVGSAEALTSDQRDPEDFSENDPGQHFPVLQIGSGITGFREANDGVGGGGGSAGETSVELNYRDVFGRGPIYDATDDILCRVEVLATNNLHQVTAKFYGFMAWNVMTVEGARETFGVP
jgi:hypothetical protein